MKRRRGRWPLTRVKLTRAGRERVELARIAHLEYLEAIDGDIRFGATEEEALSAAVGKAQYHLGRTLAIIDALTGDDL